MTLLDWSVVALYVFGAIAIGVFFTKRASASTTDFFVAGRTLPWFIAGTSIVATTFSADTPLFVAGMSRTYGIHSNWFWWSTAIGQLASVFFFAKLWRRTEALTDIEFIVKRYEPGAARSTLRIFKVFYDGVFVNCVIMASVTLAMAKIMTVMLNLSDDPLFTLPLLGEITPAWVVLLVLGAAAVLYSSLSGLYGVVYTDLIQFSLAMLGSIGLAVVVYADASSGAGMMAKLGESPDFKEALLRFVPELSSFNLLTFSFFVYLSLAWWGAAPGSGYQVQRLLACRSEKDSMLACLWYNFCHYVLRPWPWIMVGILSMIYFPGLEDPEASFPMMIDHFLPQGLKGIMVAAMLAAFMSTLDTHLNWGTSYLINDFYQPFVAPRRTMHHYVRASRICMLLLTVVALLVSTRLTGILDAYKYLGVVWGGIGTVMIARWYWWRVNPWSEITAVATTLIVGNALAILLPDVKGPEPRDYFTVRLVITMAIVTTSWVTVTLLTSRKPSEQSSAFYKKMRIPGPGWAAVARLTGTEPFRGELLRNAAGWLSAVGLIYCLLLATGKFIFGAWLPGLGFAMGAALSWVVLRHQLRRQTFL